jgi:hypothetical protein
LGDNYNVNSVGSGASLYKSHKSNEVKNYKQIVPLIPLRVLDNALDYPDVAIIKIDVELAELEVFQALQNLIESQRPWILIEILPVYRANNTFRLQRQELLLSLIRQTNYFILRIIKDKKDRILKLELIEEIAIHSDLSLCDYILCPNEERLSELHNLFQVTKSCIKNEK